MSDSMPRIPRRNKKEDDPKMIGLWKIGRTIGKGSSGRVRIARHSKTGQYAAVKIVSKQMLLNSRIDMKNIDEEADRILHGIEREIVIMKLIEHPNIMRLYDVWETSTELFLILEYVEGGELFEYLCSKGRLSTSEALGYFQQIMTAVNYCHRFNIAHRDLKPENLLLDADKNIKVADFGMAAWQGQMDMLQTACGSPHYAAPEVVMGQAYNGALSDIWSCGIILFALLTGRLPFDDEDLVTLLEKVKIGKFCMPPDIDARAKDLLSKMLEKDVSKRITVDGVLKHPFYTSQPSKITSCHIPCLDDIARPLVSAAEIDAEIFANLRTLWPGISDEMLSENLINDKKTWEKGVYHLLERYQAKHHEAYDKDEEKLSAKRRARRSKRKAKQHMEVEAFPPRAAPPTPRRARREGDGDSSPDAGPSQLRKVTAIGSDLFFPRATPTTEEDPCLEFPSPSPRIGHGDLPFDIPDVQDERIQQFFHQIVEHLNMMQTTSPQTPSSILMNSPPRQAPPSTLLGTPLSVDLGLPFNAVYRSKHDGLPLLNMPADISRHVTNTTQPLSIRRRKDKENTPLGSPSYLTAEIPERKPSLRSNSTKSGNNSDRHIRIVEPSAKLEKKPSSTESPTSSAFSGSSAGSFFLSQTPKEGWFGNFFGLKPKSYQLLSTHDAYITRRECRRVLESMGVAVELFQEEGMGVLKCKMGDMKDPAGILPSIKGVRFRVELKIPATVHAIAGFTVTLNLMLEKGAASTFRIIYARLKREWVFDTPSAGHTTSTHSSGAHSDERFVEIVHAS